MKSIPISSPGRATRPFRATRKGSGSIVALLLGILPVLSATAAIGDWDPQFGVNGLVYVSGNAGPNLLELTDGKVLVIGTLENTNGTGNENRQVALNRYLSSGEPDASYGVNGHLTLVLPIPVAGISAIALQHDGKVVLAGTSWATNGTYSFVARVDAVGVLDPTFGSGGVAAIAGTEPHYGSVAVLPTGVIVAPISDWTNDHVHRFATDGRLLEDKMRGFIAPARLALQHDGRIIVSGWSRDLKQAGVVRLGLDGSVDTTFGSDGFTALDADYSYSLAVEPGTDRIVLCGPGFVRLTAAGHLDPSFGVNGTGYVAFGENHVPGFHYCRRLLPMWDGTLVYIGTGPDDAVTGVARAFVAGLTSDGNADLRFGAGAGAREIEIGRIERNWAPYPDYSNALIRTHDGDALLTWATPIGLQLGRIDLGAGTGSDIPPPPIPGPIESPPASTTPPPPTTPPAPAGDGSGTDRGGGGASGWLDIGLLIFIASQIRSRRFMRFHEFPRTAIAAIGKVGHGSDSTSRSIHQERTMNNMTIRSVALGVAVLLGAANAATVDAQAIGRTQAAVPLVGTWQVVITPYNCLTGESFPISFKSRLQFSAGGTMAETPFNPGFQPGQSTSGLGTWGATGQGSYYNVFEAYVTFTDNYIRGVRRVDQTIEMADTDHWTSSAVVTFTDEDGHVVPPTGCMNATGERLQ